MKYFSLLGAGKHGYLIFNNFTIKISIKSRQKNQKMYKYRTL